MINPNEINLLIFDLDGTLLPTTRPTFEAIKRAFAKLQYPVAFSEKDLEQYLGGSSEVFYQAIRPPDSTLSWQEVRLKVRLEYEAALTDNDSTYPAVKETLAALRKRGYKLALCSLSGSIWFKTAISALNLQAYFDYCECTEDCQLTKTQMIDKIKDQLGAPAAVIGDRIYDIEAAVNTHSLSIGVLYGYGGREAEQADLVITHFPDLLKIFDRKRAVFEKVEQAIRQRKGRRALVVGITGIDLSGKTQLTESLAAYLTSRHQPVMVIHLDDFHHPRAYRNSGADPVENYWQRNFNYAALIRELLIPIREKSEYSTVLTLLDLLTDQYQVQKQYSFERDTIVLLEGIFLFRPELSPYLDYKIFVDIPFEESRRRAVIRDVPIFGDTILKRYTEKYWPAQKRYLEEYPPRQKADLVIDNCNWEYPVIQPRG
jgi:phosphoglycolate phosphatase-like HAD superfamily hydrolase/uridine kinase